MPVPTTTFRNIKRLNVLFAISAVALLASTLWLIVADHEKPWRQYQRDARTWDVAIREDAQRAVVTADALARRQHLELAVQQLREAIDSDTHIQQLRQRLAQLQDAENKLKLPLNIARGEIVPAEQRVEMTSFNPDSREAIRARENLRNRQARFEQINREMATIVHEMDNISEQLEKAEERLTETRADLTRHELELTAIAEIIESLAPSSFAARLVQKGRDAPLLNWFNPWEMPRQVVDPAIHTDLHFMTVETVDRCMTCHVNIDRPEFELDTLLSFLERQIAVGRGHDVSQFEKHQIEQPAVLADFWINAAQTAGLHAQVEQIKADTLEQVNEVRQRAKLPAIELDQLPATLAAMAGTRESDLTVVRDAEGQIDAEQSITLGQWYSPAADMTEALMALLQNHLAAEEFNELRDVYRQAAVAELNKYRARDGLAALSDSRVLLAHPRLDLYVSTDSPHPMETPGNPIRTLGCTVCHEGAGQETEFVYTVHTPRDVWVDAVTGATVPAFMVRRDGAPSPTDAVMVRAATTARDEVTAMAQFLHDGVYLADPADSTHPYRPQAEGASRGEYVHPVSGEVRRVVKQEEYWKKSFGWKHTPFMYWEKPMHSLEYVESSCNKCHTDIFDIAEEAPRLFEGRTLFAQIGCVNCHAVSDLDTAMDVKKVGPSLVHVKEKLSPDMMGSWIWSPRGFRPTSKMPHYFMLENNSSPIDIRRTRTEVMAMTYYLRHAEPDESYYHSQNKPLPYYKPEPLPEEYQGSSEESIGRGRDVFNTIGCLACHSNLDDQTKPWLVADLAKQLGLDSQSAEAHVEQMSYNERHWYAMRHIPERISTTGPELSGVGTKLMAGWPQEEAFDHAKAWLYDWIRNPQHYSDYTIMPSLRLNAQQASDVADYLLSLTRPSDSDESETYQPGSFDVDAVDEAMLKELIVTLQAAQSTPEIVRQEIDGNPDLWTTEYQLQWLGQRMVSHYGCSGCHKINGFEDAASACTMLDDWGMKDPAMLDFGYFSNAGQRQRGVPFGTWQIPGHGLTADTPHHTAQSAEPVQLKWEHFESLERRPWLYHKLHNPRIYDRGRIAMDGDPDTADATQSDRLDVGRPYDKLKMPQFYLTDRQVRAITTYVTGITAPGVTPEFQMAATNEQQKRIALGRQVATLYNCMGCHNIEGNRVSIHDYYGIYDAEGNFDDNLLNWAPPRLIGQGSKTQPDWLYHFLQNVNGHPNIPAPGQPSREGENKIRPWLEVRMPSYPMSPDEARRLVDYFAAHSQKMSAQLHVTFMTIEMYLTHYDEQIAQLEGEIRNIERDIANLEKQSDNPLAPTRLEHLQAMKQSRLDRIDEARQRGEARQRDWFDTTDENVQSAIADLIAFAKRTDLIPNLARLNAEEVPDPQARAEQRRANWNALLLKTRFLANAWATDYPYAQKHRPSLSAEQFVRGEQLFVTMGCMTGECHRVGDEDLLAQHGFSLQDLLGEEGFDDGFGFEDDPWGMDDPDPADPGFVVNRLAARADVQPGGAANLTLAYQRLQPHWVEYWLRFSHAMQPGTRMQEYWMPDPNELATARPGAKPAGRSHFRVIPYPEEQRDQFESLYGTLDSQQRQLVMDFLYAVGPRAITYSPEGERLSGQVAAVELTPLQPLDPAAPPAEAPTPADAPPPAETPAAPAPEPVVEQPAQPEYVAPVSTIENFHDEPTQPYADGTRVIGRIAFDGQVRPPARLRMDPACTQAARGLPPAVNEIMLVNEDGSFRNVVVHVVKGLEGKPRPQITDPFIFDQEGCVYIPHTAAVMAGQPVEIHNSDNLMHNVNYSGRNPAFNDAMVKGVVLNKVFNVPEVGGMLRCNVHPWMGATISVFDHPYFAVTDVEGRFEIKGLPPGTYTLETWHENRRIAPVQFEVTVEAETSTRVDATLR